MRTVADPETLARLLARLSGLRSDTPRRWGTMTPGEMLCHLADASSSVLSQAVSKLPPGRSRPFLKWVGLYSPLPWPHGAKTSARIDPRRDGTRPGEFEQDLQRTLAGLRALAAASPPDFLPTHSVFGTMTPRDWQRWAYRHTDHHLRQFGL